jgi:hypothetical protein
MTFRLMNAQVLARIQDSSLTKPLNLFVGMEVI